MLESKHSGQCPYSQ